MRGLAQKVVKLSGAAAKTAQLFELGLPPNLHLSADPKHTALTNNLLPVVEYSPVSQTCVRPRRSVAPRATTAKPRRQSKQLRPFRRVKKVLQQARHYAVTAESADDVCAVVSTGRRAAGSSGGALDETYESYSAEVALTLAEPSAITVVEAEGDGVCATWVGVGPERASPESFDDKNRVYLQHGMDGFDLAAWGANASDAYDEVRHLTESAFHQRSHDKEDPNRDQAVSSEFGWSYISFNRNLFDAPWMLHTTESISTARKDAAAQFTTDHLLPLLPHLWNICKAKFPELAAETERYTAGSPYNLGGTPWCKVTCSADNPSLTHYDANNKYLTCLVAFKRSDELVGGSHVILSPDLSSGVVVIDSKVGWIIVGDYASILHGNLATQLGARFIINPYVVKDVADFYARGKGLYRIC